MEYNFQSSVIELIKKVDDNYLSMVEIEFDIDFTNGIDLIKNFTNDVEQHFKEI